MSILYEKIGRRYKPVMTNDWYHMGRMFEMEKPGHILVSIDKSMMCILRQIDPARVEVLAALKECREAISDGMHKASEFKPRREKLSVRHQEAYALYQASIPKEEREALWAGSIQDGLDAAEKVLAERISK